MNRMLIRELFLISSLMFSGTNGLLVAPVLAAARQPLDLGVFRHSLESGDCHVRKRAVLDVWRALVPSDEPKRNIEKLRQLVGESPGELQRRLALVLNDAETAAAFWEKRWKELSFVERFRGAQSPAEIPGLIEQAKKSYMALIKDSDEHVLVRLYASGEMLFAIDRFYQFSKEKRSPFPPEALPTWTSDILGLLNSQDPTVRLIGALARGVRPGIPGATLTKGSVIPVLISGLRHPEFSLRIRSLTVLEALTGRDSCLDPTDPEVVREPEIRQWEDWWRAEAEKLAPEKLPAD